MSPTLQQDLKQKRPFRSLQQEAYLSVVRTSTSLTDAMEDLLKDRGISATQYNVLRILRGSGPDGLCRNALRDRMLTRMPDMTRLLDRMEEAGLVVRAREGEDRRMVLTHITAKGRQLLDDLDAPVLALHERQMARLTGAQLRTLSDLLTLVREGGGA
ncbi:MAG: MarR family transcriptional regulator [Gemmatimonadetes bacterium]|jgi:DNA-binding MarR family transcriptional regulator|nr:MarR family transcriptional regulator [Gemmatimonadota bacterium]